jgi:hypothetical protein
VGIVNEASNGYYFTVAETKRIVSVTSLPFPKHKQIESVTSLPLHLQKQLVSVTLLPILTVNISVDLVTKGLY